MDDETWVNFGPFQLRLIESGGLEAGTIVLTPPVVLDDVALTGDGRIRLVLVLPALRQCAVIRGVAP